jgi:hypothetical protein
MRQSAHAVPAAALGAVGWPGLWPPPRVPPYWVALGITIVSPAIGCAPLQHPVPHQGEGMIAGWHR